MTMTEDRIAQVLAAPYARVIRPAEEGGFNCEVLEFPGCYATGDDAAEATENLEEAMSLWVETTLGQGQDIPEPISADDYSGRFTLRLPPSIHHRADLLARVEGVSLNRFLSAAVAQYVGEASTSWSEPMLRTVEIYAVDDETQLLGRGTLEHAVRESAGEYSSLLRPPPDLPAGWYVLRFASGERWPVETLSAPGQGGPISGQYVTAVSHEPRPE